MAETVIMPKLGFDMAEGTLVRWVVAEGENVAKGAILAEIETDKATVEVESTYEGEVLRHLVPQGSVVPVGTPIAVIGAAGEQVELPEEVMAAPAEQKEESKGAQPVAAEAAPAAQATQQAVSGEPVELGSVRASPLARKLAAENQVDLRQVRGSGPGGRIVRKDIETILAEGGKVKAEVRQAQVSAPTEQPAALPPVSPVMVTPGVDKVVPLTRLRAAIGRRMSEAMQQVPHFYITHEYDMAAVMDLRKQFNELLPEEEKLSVNDFIVKAVALALREFPNLNASIDLAKEQIVQHGSINVGVAVAMESGLLTVVSRDTEQKPLRQIAAELREMVQRARSGKVRPEDIEGSTFTVSNLGMFDVEQFTAIINPPEASILAVGSVKQVPVVVDGDLQISTRMKATLSVDHRVSDGAEGARFLQAVAKYLESPLRLIL